MQVADGPQAIARPSTRGITAVMSIAALSALTFFFVAAVPYFLSSEHGGFTYANRRGWLLMHIAGGAVALLTGPVQLWLGLADRGMGWHRRMGVIYMAAVAVSSIAAFYLAFNTEGGFGFGAGLVGLGIAWLSTTGLAFLAIRGGLYDVHKEWMIRSYVVTFGFVFFRMVFPALQALEIGTLQEQLSVAAWSCWAVPLLVTELVIQGRKILAVR
jgi:hypothetical protein